MTGRKRAPSAKAVLHMRRHSARSTWVDGAMAVPLAKRSGCAYQRKPTGPGWLIPAGATDDFEALAEHMGLTVEWVIV
jgi:hypothetical protein